MNEIRGVATPHHRDGASIDKLIAARAAIAMYAQRALQVPSRTWSRDSCASLVAARKTWCVGGKIRGGFGASRFPRGSERRGGNEAAYPFRSSLRLGDGGQHPEGRSWTQVLSTVPRPCKLRSRERASSSSPRCTRSGPGCIDSVRA